MSIARELVGVIATAPELEHVVAAPPGFINFTLKSKWLTGQVDSILSAGENYGNINIGKGSRVQVEFVQRQPDGTAHVGHGRGAILGSTLANMLAAAGYDVEKEYYINDAGNQVNTFYQSLYARYKQSFGIDAEIPPDGYQGNYMIDLAKEIVSEEGDRFLTLPEPEALEQLGQIGLDRMIKAIRADLESIRVNFDVWSASAASLKIDNTIQQCRSCARVVILLKRKTQPGLSPRLLAKIKIM